MDKVILLHGLYMHEFAMWPLARRLNDFGWQTECLSYNSLHIETEVLFKRIDKARGDGPAYLVGHSLGGVLLHRYAESRDLPEDSRIVTLGSPLQGAQIADRLASWNLSAILGNSGDNGLLSTGHRQWHSKAKLGSLAGNHGVGLGYLIGGTDKNQQHDGTVLVSETQLEGMTDHLILPVNHTAMLMCRQTAEQTHHFLRFAQFNKNVQ